MEPNCLCKGCQVLLPSTLPALSDLKALKVGDVQARILDEEAHLGGGSSALAALKTVSKPLRNRNNLFCMHCKRHNHVIETCWQLHGKPEEKGELKGNRKDLDGGPVVICRAKSRVWESI